MIATDVSGRSRRLAAVVGAVMLLVGLLGSTAAEGRTADLAPMAVPPATGNNAVITVQVGADRIGTTGVSPLAGVTLQLYNGTTAPTTPVTDAWATCVSDADGDCSFVVPDTQTGALGCLGVTAGENCDRRFWVVQTGVPSGFTENPVLRTGNGDGSGSQQTPYQFRTGSTLRAGNTYTSTSDFMIGSGNSNRVASGGTWQQSRTNPAPVQQCGLDVALVLDLSGSVTQSQLVSLKAAASSFADSLVGTPSQMALFSFSTISPAAGATQNYPALTSVSTQAGANTFKSRYASWTAEGGTNWDRGLAVPAQANPTYDIAVVITDGDPTFYSQPAEGPGNFNRLREMENGIFSANALKAEGTRVLAVGVGSGVSDPATSLNLAAISGQTAYDGTNATTADYFQVSNYSVVADALNQLALGECAGSLSVVKQIVGPDGDVDNATPGGAGWTFNASTASAGVELPTGSATTDASSAVNFPITYDGGVTSGTVEVEEEPQEGTTLFPVGGSNAVCTNLDTGASVPVVNSGPTGFTVDVSATAAVSCTVYNQAVAPASITVDKEWVINGADPVPQGNQPSGFTAQLTLTGPDGAGATDQGWGQTRPGYAEDDVVTIDEDVTLQAPAIDPDLCEVSTPQIVEINGSPVDPVPVPEAGYEATLAAGANTYTIRNTVDCESRLTLAKDVEGQADPGLWDLAALPAPGTPSGQLPGPSGEAGSAAVTDQVVSAGIPYQLAESGGLPTYTQVDNRTDLQTYPLSTGSWSCSRIGSDGEQIPGFSDGLNGGVTVPIAERILCTATNQTGRLTLAKQVVNESGGTAVASDFTLRAIPDDTPPVEGLADVEVTGAAPEDAAAVEIRPNHVYTLSETGPDGYDLTELNCFVGGVPQPRTRLSVAPGEDVICVFVNTDSPAELTLRKQVEAGTTGATDTPADWTLTATPQDIPDQDPVSGDGAEGVTDVNVIAGTYDLSEAGPEGYDASDWTCEGTGGTLEGSAVTLANGASVTCTITNTAQPSSLTLVKDVVNDAGGTAVPTDWTLSATGPTAGISGVTGSAPVTNREVAIGSYALAESGGPAGYGASDWVCLADGAPVPVVAGSVSVGLGTDVTCTITNDDAPGTLTLVKEVVNDNGGTAGAGDWTLSADGPTPITGTSGSDAVTGATVESGAYDLSESGPDGYTASDWDCGDATLEGSTVTVPNGAEVTCTITNDDQPGTLTLVKEVVNDDGGTAEPGDWTLRAAGPTTITGTSGSDAVTGVAVSAGAYDLTESGGPGGYTPSAWTCTGGTVAGITVTVPNGGDVTCTITNDDQPGSLTLVKVVENDNGGSAVATDWTLSADGPTPLAGTTGSEAVTDASVDAGDYDLSESGPGGYTASDWSCTGATVTGATVAVPNGGDVTCTITNNDQPATLTLVKQVVNNNGGSAVATDWTLSAEGPSPITGTSGSEAVTGAVVSAGSYGLAEAGGPAGYTASDWSCTGATVTGATVTVPNGGDVTCTITNDDQPGSLTLVKEVVNDGGGTAEPTDWTLSAEGPSPITGTSGSEAVTGAAVDAGGYELSESGGPAGYTASDWDCGTAAVAESTVTVPNGGDVTCTITNTYEAPQLTLVKEVVNDDGGTADATDWTLTATGPNTLSGVTGSEAVTAVAVTPGAYALAETGPSGYTASDWVCANRGQPLAVEGSRVTVDPGAAVTCTITNDDDAVPPASTWTAVKTSDPASGSQVEPGDIITYTVRAGIVTGESVDGVVVVDDLSRVLDHAALVEGSIEASAGTAGLSGNRLTWNVGMLEGVQTLTYKVRVDDDVDGDRLRNVVTADGAEPCPPEGPVLGGRVAAEDDCRTTTHSTPTAASPNPPSPNPPSPAPPAPGGPWIPDTGGPSLWLVLGALALMFAGAWTMGRARRRTTGASAQGDGVDDGV